MEIKETSRNTEAAERVCASPALRALLDGFIDYAGIFPPAKVPLENALANYSNYRQSEHSWMLRWFVVGAGECANVPAQYDGTLSIIKDGDDGRAATLESTAIVSAPRPVYCEVPLSNLSMLAEVKKQGNFGKIRTGGLKPEAIPSCRQVAAFIAACAELKLPFKATAGLHHPLRSMQPLTYAADSEKAVMHGFINVLMAAAFAYHGFCQESELESLLDEQDAAAFKFDQSAHWRGKSLSVKQIEEARRNFIHSVGSCSFEEPVRDLQALGWLA